MADGVPQERLQPALLDRLIDDEPTNQGVEALERRVLSKARLRQAVLRDLGWLFNSANLGTSVDLSGAPNVASSVINFGLPPLSGETAATIDIVDLELMIRRAIEAFEPRILPGTLEVAPIVVDDQMHRKNVVSIQIRGMLWAQPMPLEILLRTNVDIESGQVDVVDLSR